MGSAGDPARDSRYTRDVAAFVSTLRFEQIPSEVIERIKLLILDSLGCALYSADLEWSQILMRTLAQVDSTPACTRVGHVAAALGAACGARQRHARPGIRARRCASSWCAARRCGDASVGSRHRGDRGRD